MTAKLIPKGLPPGQRGRRLGAPGPPVAHLFNRGTESEVVPHMGNMPANVRLLMNGSGASSDCGNSQELEARLSDKPLPALRR